MAKGGKKFNRKVAMAAKVLRQWGADVTSTSGHKVICEIIRQRQPRFTAESKFQLIADFLKVFGPTSPHLPKTDLPHKPKKQPKPKPKSSPDRTGFYWSDEWRELRYEVLKEHDGLCEVCGRGRKHGIILHVDHIKPRSKYPHLELEKSNLQVLCEDCNIGKKNHDEIDWRQSQPEPEPKPQATPKYTLRKQQPNPDACDITGFDWENGIQAEKKTLQ